ncbi:MAG: hypothetical protein HY663_01100 [Chloroflexi bacterium]|nr:hypothetical protein [Chloroflexota bacterium]
MADAKKLNFALVGHNAPWWMLGEITKKALAHEGFEVELSRSNREEQVGRVARGEADFGVNGKHQLAWAYRGIAQYEGQPLSNLRAIASVDQPHWLAFAVTYETRLTAIEQIKSEEFPLRIFTPHSRYGGRVGSVAFIVDKVLDAYGFTLEDIERWGGKVWTSENGGDQALREGNFDAMTARAFAAYGPGPAGQFWQVATIRNNLRFLPITSDVLDKLCQRYDLHRGLMPKLLMRGVDEDVPTFYFPNTVIYTSAQTDEELAFTTAKGLDEHCECFLEGYVPFCYNPFRACQDTGAPLHPGAERYYRSRGYLK